MIPALLFLFFTLASFNSESKVTYIGEVLWLTPVSPADIQDHEDGRKIYTTYCIRCHNANPNKPGVIGPDLVTTPLEVFRTKVPSGTYPPKYISKRKTRVMPKFPQLKEKTELIYNYIQTFKTK